MKEKEIEFIKSAIKTAKSKIHEGKVADYIPELAHANPDVLGVTIHRLGEEAFTLGDCHHLFTLQSISKVFSLIIALNDHGEEALFEKVGMEPTGDGFNSMVKLEQVDPGKPFNPMINAGALVVTSMIKGKTPEIKYDRILSLVRTLANDDTIGCNQAVYESEMTTADLNRSLAYFLKQSRVLLGEVDEHISVYSKHCSIEVNCRHLAKMGLVFSNKGVDPDTGVQLIPKRYVEIAKVFMSTCGMYNSSGEFAIQVGIPAKSGVSGGIMASVPGKMGIGVIGPSLNAIGNSIAGVELLKLLSKEWTLSVYR